MLPLTGENGGSGSGLLHLSTSRFFEHKQLHQLPRTPTEKRHPSYLRIPPFQMSPLHSRLKTSQPGGAGRHPDRAGLNPTQTPSPLGRKTPLKALKLFSTSVLTRDS